MKNPIKFTPFLLGGGVIVLAGFCLTSIVVFIGGRAWQPLSRRPPATAPAARATRRLPTFTPTTSPTPLPTSTPTASPTPSPTATTVPPSPTPIPPTSTVAPTPTPALIPTPLPVPSPTPTDTPAPVFPFSVVETAKYPTSHQNFDVYIAITNANNTPLSGYKIVGLHSTGLRVESPVSAGDWTENSGAMHYKAGNIKFSVPNSPTGVWTLQLQTESGEPAAPPVQFPFDAAAPTWYFLLYRRNG